MDFLKQINLVLNRELQKFFKKEKKRNMKKKKKPHKTKQNTKKILVLIKKIEITGSQIRGKAKLFPYLSPPPPISTF